MTNLPKLRPQTDRRWKHSLAVLAATLLICLCIVRSNGQDASRTNGCAAEHYRIVAIPLRPHRVNDADAVAGMTEQRRAALWTREDGLKVMELPAGFHSAEGLDINGHGQFLGTASSADGSHRQSFVYEDGKLSMVTGEGARGNAINANGDLAGEAKLPGAATIGPVLWVDGKPINLGACCGGRATSLNDHGQVAGEVYDKQGRYGAFIWDQKSGLKLIGPPDIYSTSAAINESGDVVVYAFTQGSFLYQSGKLTRMELSKRWPSQPRAINGCGVAVGSFGANSDESEAFLWDAKNGFRDLNDLVPKNSGWKLEVAASINERGEIAGWGDHGGEDDAGFLLIPQAP